jgi:hypothetical protein
MKLEDIQMFDSVIVNDPEAFDHEWTGTVTGFRHGMVQVTDSEDDTWEVDPEVLTLDEES